MNITEALQRENNRLRICDEGRCLISDGFGGWIVYQETADDMFGKVLICTRDEHRAVEMLLEGE